MKILLVLPNEQSAFVMLQRSLQELGNEVEFFFYRSVASLKVPGPEWLRWRIQRFTPVDFVGRMNARLIEVVRQGSPDLVFINKGEIIAPETIATIQSMTTVAAWYVDSPLWFGNATRDIAYSLQHYDVAFVFDGYYIPEMRRWGCRRAEVLSFGCEPAIHRTVRLVAAEKRYFASDLCFVGDYHGVGSSRESILSRLTDYNLKIWGRGWKYSPDKKLRDKWMGRPLAIEELAKAYSGSSITLNVTYPHSITEPNMRTFEAPACGILLLNDFLSGLPRFLEPGKEIEVYASVDELVEKINYYLAHPQEAAQIAEAGQRRVHREHTYRARMSEMLSIVFG